MHNDIDDSHVKQYQEIGMDKVIEKPISPNLINEFIDTRLSEIQKEETVKL